MRYFYINTCNELQFQAKLSARILHLVLLNSSKFLKSGHILVINFNVDSVNIMESAN